MQTKLWKLLIQIHGFVRNEDGQDLIEYALIVALIAFGAVAGMSSVAGSINNAFGNIANTMQSYTG